MSSGSTVLEAGVILAEGEERNVKAEDLVLIRNRNGNEIMAVCRGGLGSNENLRTSNYSPGVAYARVGRHPSNAKEFYAFGLSVIGNASEGVLKENKMLIAPSSEVEIFEEHDNPMAILGDPASTIGYYKDHPSWRVPINPSYICYPMGVFASTGAGKSLLTRHEIIPFIRAAGYKMLIFDWKGSDYAPYFKCRPHKNEGRIWKYANILNLEKAFRKQRKRTAHKLQNPRLLKIHFHLLRHWKATVEYAKTKDLHTYKNSSGTET